MTNVELVQLSLLPAFSKSFCFIYFFVLFFFHGSWGQRFVLALKVLHKRGMDRVSGEGAA